MSGDTIIQDRRTEDNAPTTSSYTDSDDDEDEDVEIDYEHLCDSLN